VGVVRDHNEDSAHIDEQADFFVVADGMGGHAAGEVASAMAVETVTAALAEARAEIASFANKPTDRGRKELVALLEAAVRKAHSAVYSRGVKEPDKQGMGTTLDVVLLAGPEAFVAHVGDSRTYLIRDGRAAQITTDHTVAEVLVIEGKLSLEEAQHSPLRTILVNAIGVAPDVGVEMAHVRLRKDDLLLVSSDGLHDYFPAEQELADHSVGIEPGKALGKMVELAKSRGGHDNITGILVEVLDAPAADPSVTPFENEQTQPAAGVSDGVPEPIASGDTLPHELLDEAEIADSDTEELDEAAAGDDELDAGDIKATIPLRPVSVPTAERESTDSSEGARRRSLARASTEPPEQEVAAKPKSTNSKSSAAKKKKRRRKRQMKKKKAKADR
jgi:serine/threonine protein phosphatase PrpC